MRPDTAEIASLYDEVAEEYDERWSRRIDHAEDEVIFRRWLEPLARKRNVLDLGCGTGHLLDFVEPRHYVGIDPSEGMIDVARRKHADRDLSAAILVDGVPESLHRLPLFIQSEAERCALLTHGNWFDLACATWAFSYFPDQLGVLRGMHRSLGRGGWCFVHGFSARYAERTSYVLDGRGDYKPTNPAQLTALMRAAGFREVSVGGFRFLPDNPLFERLPVKPLADYLELEARHLPASLGLTHFAFGRK